MKWAVFLGRAVSVEALYDLPGHFVHVVRILGFRLEIVVRAVEVADGGISNCLRPGLLGGTAQSYAGQIFTADIGIPEKVLKVEDILKKESLYL